VTYWLKRLQAIGAPEGQYQKPQALVTITKGSLPLYKEIVDEYKNIGAGGIFLRFIHPLGTAEKSMKHLGYTAQEYIDFYRKALDYIIEINKKGTPFMENSAAILLSKILTGHDPKFLDLRSPCGAGIGQVVYHYNGAVYTCDEGRMLSALGDESFRISSSVDQFSFDQLGESPVVMSCCTASCQEVMPGCSQCAYQPYCGTCPVINHKLEGHIYKKSAYLCAIRLGVLDIIFDYLKNPHLRDILLTWVRSEK
jgi:radical SAM protein with 4Fe4S-binding SPASM domain